jgi:hypothetical protein
MDAMQIEYEEKIEKIQDDQKEELEKLRKENDELKTCSLLLESYKKIRDQNCDLTLELAGGKTLEVHKTILIGNN